MLDPNKFGAIALPWMNSEKMWSENKPEGNKPLGTIGKFINQLKCLLGFGFEEVDCHAAA
jgi:hypothetical protein